VRSQIARAAFRERLTYDLRPLRRPVARVAHAFATSLLASPSLDHRARAFALLMRLHSSGIADSLDQRIISRIARAMEAERHGRATGFGALLDQTIREAIGSFFSSPKPDPVRLIGSRILVVKPYRPSERGVIVVDYSYVFPLLAGLFDLNAISERYDLVLEPSWAGSCAPETLLFTRLDRPVFVESIEPRDRDFLNRLKSNLEVVPLAANWWVDHRHAPAVGGARDIDVIMVASWADIKRHWRVFRVLAELRRRGHRLKTVLVGYQLQRTKADIEALAAHFGIADQVEAYERISQEEVSRLLARSKVHVLWSRRECANRAVIEAMLADVPVIVRDGLTFGFKYPYINDQTGRFVPEAGLGDAILDMVEHHRRYSPRQWALDHMTCEKATQVLNDHIRDRALAAGQPWTEDLVVKTSSLDVQRYWNPDDAARFTADYAFLESAIRSVR
jgi:glycosyltransferase involved in cell wall biosynthesis